MLVEEEMICMRPDGKPCRHREDEHGGIHPLVGGSYCFRCFAADGVVLGPFAHAYNPHILTAAGWLPLKERRR